MDATYSIALLHQATGATHEVWADYNRIHYVKRALDVGTFEIELSGTWGLGTESQYTDWRVVVWRQPTGKRRYIDFAGFVRYAGYSYHDNQYTTRLAGVDYHDVLARRVVAYKAATAQARKASAEADDLMKELVAENLGASATDTDRDITGLGFSIQADLTAGTSVAKSCSFRNLLTVLQEVAEASRSTEATAAFFEVAPLGDGYDMDFRTKIGQLGQDHTHPNGVDGPVVFAVEWGNMAEPELVFDRWEEKNYVYGLGAGQEEDRMLVEVSDTTRMAASVLNRREGIFDGGNYETEAKLTSATQSRLEEGQPRRTFSFSPIDLANCAYGVHWALGDKVTASFLGRQFDQHITSVDVTVDGRGEQVEARAGQWP